MQEPDAGTGSILTMECPVCGRIGLRFMTGENALGKWERHGALLGNNRDIPADVPPDTTVVFCGEECGHVEYGELDWSMLPPTAVQLDASSVTDSIVW
jgi:hypothetical protein